MHSKAWPLIVLVIIGLSGCKEPTSPEPEAVVKNKPAAKAEPPAEPAPATAAESDKAAQAREEAASSFHLAALYLIHQVQCPARRASYLIDLAGEYNDHRDHARAADLLVEAAHDLSIVDPTKDNVDADMPALVEKLAKNLEKAPIAEADTCFTLLEKMAGRFLYMWEQAPVLVSLAEGRGARGENTKALKLCKKAMRSVRKLGIKEEWRTDLFDRTAEVFKNAEGKDSKLGQSVESLIVEIVEDERYPSSAMFSAYLSAGLYEKAQNVLELTDKGKWESIHGMKLSTALASEGQYDAALQVAKSISDPVRSDVATIELHIAKGDADLAGKTTSSMLQKMRAEAQYPEYQLTAMVGNVGEILLSTLITAGFEKDVLDILGSADEHTHRVILAKLAAHHAESGDPDKAADFLLQACEAMYSPSKTCEELSKLAQDLAASGHQDEIARLSRLIARGSFSLIDLDPAFSMARAYMVLGQQKNASSKVKRSAKKRKLPGELLALARMYIEVGDYDSAFKLVRKLTAIHLLGTLEHRYPGLDDPARGFLRAMLDTCVPSDYPGLECSPG